MKEKLSLAFCGALVASMLLLPAIFRFNDWPWSTYPMFSMAVDVDHIWSYRVYLVNSSTGDRYQLHPFLRVRGIALVSEYIQTKNYGNLLKLIRAESINWPQNDSAFDTMELFTAKKKDGTQALTEIELKKMATFALPK